MINIYLIFKIPVSCYISLKWHQTLQYTEDTSTRLIHYICRDFTIVAQCRIVTPLLCNKKVAFNLCCPNDVGGSHKAMKIIVIFV